MITRRIPLRISVRGFSSHIGSNKVDFPSKQQTNANRDLILSILNLTTTRRETYSYLNKYSSSLGNNKTIDTPFRLLFVKIRANLFNLDQKKLASLQKTLSYLIKLGNLPLIVLDSSEIIKHQVIHQNDSKYLNFRAIENYLFDQFNTLSTLWKGADVLPITSSLSIDTSTINNNNNNKNNDIPVQLDQWQNFLTRGKLNKDTIPVLFPYIYDNATSSNLLCDSTEFMKHLITNLNNLNTPSKEILSVEKVVFIDELGGIPSIERLNNSHVFINLNQEYEEILAELHIGHLPDLELREAHVKNLKDMKYLLNEQTTGLITTLDIATESLKLNPIIYNVLTDRSLVSSSLSTSKISNDDIHTRITKTTIFKKGLSVEIHDTLDDIDLTKMKTLIDDSFRRNLNLDHYLARIKNNIHKVIVVGDYDGIAIVTNETSPSTGLTFPYLDKFAVSNKAQGSLGVADMIFNVLLKQISKKNALVWRSKKKNPVNGWYFQRSSGSLNLEGSEFRLFWNDHGRGHGGGTGRVVGEWEEEKLRAWVEIASGIQPSFDIEE